MNTLHSSLQDYLALRRGLGFKMNDAGRTLPGFVRFLEARHESCARRLQVSDRGVASRRRPDRSLATLGCARCTYV